jgi:hypothetical protein
MLILTVLSGGGSSLPHWSAPAWVSLAPFAGIGLAQAIATGRRRLVGVVLALQSVVCVALLGLMVSAGQPVIQVSDAEIAPQANPFADLHGWDDAGKRARELAQQHQLGSVAVQNWTLGSRMGWYARPLPVFVLEDRFDQFDLWAGDLAAGANTLLVDWSHMAYELPLAPNGFAKCTLLSSMTTRVFGTATGSFRFYACEGWQGSPQARLKLRTNP